MKRHLLFGIALLALAANGALGEDRVPSSSKLGKLGLSSMQVVSDEAGTQVRGKAYAVVGGRFFVSNGGPGVGFPYFFAVPFFWGGGTAVNQSGTAISGSPFPSGIAPAAAQVGTKNPITQVDGPILISNAVTVNGVSYTHSAFASGVLYAAGL